MDSYQLQCIKFQEQYANKIEKFEECILKAAKLTHAIADTAEKRCEKAWTAIKSENLDEMRDVIQWYIQQHGPEWLAFREVKLYAVDEYTYMQLPKEDLILQLHCIIILEYKDTVFKAKNKENLCRCAKNLLKKSKVFTDKELDALFLFV